MINLFQPNLGPEELLRIQNVFKSNWIGKGESVKDFETKFAENLNSNPGNFLSTTSCTEAIFLAPKIFNFTEGDEIIVPSISFPSIASAILESGASIVFCDVDPRSLNVTSEHIQKHITSKTKALFLTHYGGVPCDMDPILQICERNKIVIIEDAACSVQSFYKGLACGTIGDMGMWSFDSMKTLCTGDGGMIYMKNIEKKIEATERLYLGLPAKQKSGLDSSTSNSNNWWEFELNYPGRRAIMNNIAGAIGLTQLEKLDSFISRREKIYNIYNDQLTHLEWLTLPPSISTDSVSSYYFYWIQTEYRDKLARYLLDNGVYTTFRYWPLHKIDYLKKFATNSYPNSDYVSKVTLNIPLHQSLSDDEILKIVNLIKNFKP